MESESNSYHRAYYARNREAQKAYHRAWRKRHPETYENREQRRKDAWMAILKERGMDRCSQCGYSRCFAAIDFHHKNPKEKKFRMAGVFRRTIRPVTLAELDKTIALCKNCHMELHYGK